MAAVLAPQLNPARSPRTALAPQLNQARSPSTAQAVPGVLASIPRFCSWKQGAQTWDGYYTIEGLAFSRSTAWARPRTTQTATATGSTT